MIAPFKPAKECNEKGRHTLKGFAARLDFEDAATARQADALIEAVASAQKKQTLSLRGVGRRRARTRASRGCYGAARL